MKKFIAIGVIAIAAIIIASQKSESITNSSDALTAKIEDKSSGQIKENGGYKKIESKDIKDLASFFDFSISINEKWEIDVVNNGQMLNLYDPNSKQENDLEKSQIFVRSFVANDFRAPEEFNILSLSEQTVADRKAITYVISKRSNVLEISGQPFWRNEAHKATYVRVSEENPSRFYVFAKNPALSEAEFQRFLGSLILD